MKKLKKLAIKKVTLRGVDDLVLDSIAGAATRLRSQCETYYATYCHTCPAFGCPKG